MSKISVIIPYEQRTPGLLSKVASLWAQKTQGVVVDDESPEPARSELSDVPKGEGRSWLLSEQENQANPRDEGLRPGSCG